MTRNCRTGIFRLLSVNPKSKIQNRIWTGFIAIILTLTVGGVPAEAQQAGKIYRIGYLGGGTGVSSSMRSVQRELRTLGYVEGKNVVFERRHAEDKPERTPALAAELVRLKVDVIVAGGDGDTIPAKNATQTIPIVFLESVGDPVELGLIASLARPGGNITGFTTVAGILAGKRLELLKEAIPKLSRVAVLLNPRTEGSVLQWKGSQQAAQQLGLQLYSMEVSSADRYEEGFQEAINARSSALAVTRHRLSNAYQKRIIELAAKHRLPAIYYREDFADNGGLIAYGADEVESHRRAAAIIDKILKGTKPADIPVEQPTKFEFVVNLKTANQLGLTIPPNVLVRANRVIK